MKFTKTHPQFQHAIRRMAAERNTEPEAIYLKWREYSKWCDWGDQSPFLAEFEQGLKNAEAKPCA